jgi:hypothetical protein
MNDKKLDKIEKILGVDTIQELNALSPEDLKTAIVNANQAIKQAVEELEGNPVYQEIKENLKALSAGLKEVKKRQNSIIQYSLHLTGERGKI